MVSADWQYHSVINSTMKGIQGSNHIVHSIGTARPGLDPVTFRLSSNQLSHELAEEILVFWPSKVRLRFHFKFLKFGLPVYLTKYTVTWIEPNRSTNPHRNDLMPKVPQYNIKYSKLVQRWPVHPGLHLEMGLGGGGGKCVSRTKTV